MSKTTAVTLPPGKESEKDLIFEAADGDNADTILAPIRVIADSRQNHKEGRCVHSISINLGSHCF